MTTIAQWQPARMPRVQDGAGGDVAENPRQFVSFTFCKLDPSWLRLDPATRQAGAQELTAVIEGCRDRLLIHSYTTFGMSAETDFLLWRVARNLDDFEAMAVAMRRTVMGGWLQTPYSYLAVTGPPVKRPGTRGSTLVGGARSLLVCPLVRTVGWDALPEDERRDILRELLRLGMEVPGADWATTYSVGLGVHDGVLTFEADRPEAFPGLVEGLRRTRSSVYAQRDTPIFVCTQQDPAAILARIGGVE